MDENFVSDINDLMQIIEDSDLLVLHFPTLGKALVIDPRFSESSTPIIRLLPAGTPTAHLVKSYRRFRSGFPKVKKMSLIPWFGFVQSLKTSGVWEKIEQRCFQANFPGTKTELDSAIKELESLQIIELKNAIGSKKYHTIWSNNS
ncbi:MAG: hypothetical protein FI687_04530 [SAR202 cluster bacterium]|nr:hypothetical protein [SAR202 cluster bacterium]|tara:strand:- start:1007 stop:1444 length:438 start_codon:yes stop_codon:yes gene_type:complete